MKSISLKEICKAVGGRFQSGADENFKIENITTDTREVGANSLFIPLRGERFDGHDFILQAFEKGAACSLSEKEVSTEKPVILVENSLKALRDLAAYYLSLFNIKVVAITGSVGKTTTKDMVASVLEEKYKVLKTQGNFNNEIGLPKTVFNITDEHEVAVLEMGMNNFGEIHNLSEIAKPDIAVITNVGVAHIENLGSREGVLKAKCEIFDFMKENGVAVLNRDNDLLRTIDGKYRFKILWFGNGHVGDFYASNIVSKGLDGISCTIYCPNGEFDAEISVPGEHMVYNALTAAAVGYELGLDTFRIKRGIENFIPTARRMAISTTEYGITIINDAYNANPVSMNAAIDVLAKSTGRKVAVLGEMLELGKYSSEFHKEVGDYAAQKGIDLVICIGETFAKATYMGASVMGADTLYFKTQEEMFDKGLKGIFKKGDTVLVKASMRMHLEKTVEKLQEVK